MNILLYVDDISLLSENADDLQTVPTWVDKRSKESFVYQF